MQDESSSERKVKSVKSVQSDVKKETTEDAKGTEN